MKLGVLVLFIFMIGLVSAVSWFPFGYDNIDLKNVMNITNVNNIFSNFVNGTFTGDGSQLTGVGGGNSTFNQSFTDSLYIAQTNESNLNVNSSNYWDDLNITNSTQMENSNQELNIRESWFTTLWNSIFGTKTSDDLVEGPTNLYDNRTWNETHADSIYIQTETDPVWSINSTNVSRVGDCPPGQFIQNTTNSGVECLATAGSGDITSVQGDDIYIFNGSANGDVVLVFNETKLNETILLYEPLFNQTDLVLSINTTANIQNLLNDTGIYSTFNSTYDSHIQDNSTWNQSFADALYWDINDGSFNATYEASTGNASWNQSFANTLYQSLSDGSFNQTYENYVTANFSNKSNYWDELGSINATQMENSNGLLNIMESWFNSLFDSLFGTKDTDDLTEGTTNLYENSSWNQSGADLLYATIGSGNASWNQSFANTLYAPNTTAGIQVLVNDTGIYSTFNATYDAKVTDNESWNQSFADTIYAIIGSGNDSWNQSFADTLYWDINDGSFNATYEASVGNASWNESHADTLYWDINDGSFNATYESNEGNLTWNQSLADTLYQSLSDGSFNQTYENYVNANFSNRSNYWDGLNIPNSTQMDGFNQTLSIKESWFTTLWNVIFGTKDTDDLNEGTTNLYENSTWNESHANGLYAPIGSGNASWNESHADTLYWGINLGSFNATYVAINTTSNIQGLLNDTGIYSTFNATYAASQANNTFNESYTDNLYWDIDLGSANTTYDNYVTANFSNISNYWDGLNIPNSTQMENSDQELNIRESWFTTLFNVIFGTKDTDDLSEGSTNLYENASWNQSGADLLYWDIDLGSANATYLSYETNVSFGDIFVNETGDSMTGNLNMTNNSIVGLNETLFTGGGFIRDNGSALILGHL